MLFKISLLCHSGFRVVFGVCAILAFVTAPTSALTKSTTHTQTHTDTDTNYTGIKVGFLTLTLIIIAIAIYLLKCAKKRSERN